MYTLTPLPVPSVEDSLAGFYIWIVILVAILVWAGSEALSLLRSGPVSVNRLASAGALACGGIYVLAMLTHAFYEATFYPGVPVNKPLWATFETKIEQQNRVPRGYPTFGVSVKTHRYIRVTLEDTKESVLIPVNEFAPQYPPKIRVYWNPSKKRERL